MRIEQLAYFVEIVRSGSMNAASEKLHITHQSLNRSMKQLEEELQTSLFRRTPQGVSLTKAGQKTLSAAKQVLEIIDELKSSLQPEIPPASPLKANLSVAISPIASAVFFPRFFRRFHELYPQVNLSFLETPPAEVAPMVLSHNCDLGLTNVPHTTLPTLEQPFHVQHLWQDTAMVMVSKQSPLAKRKSLSWRTVLSYPFIIYNSSPQKEHWFYQAAEPYGLPKQIMTTNSVSIFVENIVEGHYISLFTKQHWHSLSDDLKENLIMIPLRSKTERELFTSYTILLTAKDVLPSAAAQAFIALVNSEKSQ